MDDDKPIVYVVGNHDFYHGQWDHTLEQLRRAAAEHDAFLLESNSSASSD